MRGHLSATTDGTVAFFFGDGKTEAAPDEMKTYDQGAVKAPPQSKLTIGNFAVEPGRTATGDSSRVFRGLLDEVRFFNTALSIEEIRCQQRS